MAMIAVKHKRVILKHMQRGFFSASYIQDEKRKTDVLIVGGGITGASLACALSQSEFF